MKIEHDIFTRTDEIARYRISLKKVLKIANIPFERDAPTEILEALVSKVPNTLEYEWASILD